MVQEQLLQRSSVQASSGIVTLVLVKHARQLTIRQKYAKNVVFQSKFIYLYNSSFLMEHMIILNDEFLMSYKLTLHVL